MTTLHRAVFAPALLLSCLTAQATLLVGPGGFGTINAALAAAAAGDLVLVQPGTYAGFQATVGVTIRGTAPSTVFVTSASTVANAPTPTHLADLDLKLLQVNGSTCSLDRCRVTAIPFLSGTCLGATDSFVQLSQCTVGAAGDPPQFGFLSYGLMAINSTISAIDSTIRGRDQDLFSTNGGSAALYLSLGSRLHGSRLTVSGGNGTAGSANLPGPALVASIDSTVWIRDSTFAGGAATNLGLAPWQCPVDAVNGRLVHCTLLPSSCASPAVPQTGALLGVHRVAPPLAGGPLQLDFQGEPNEFVGVFASLGLAANALPQVEQPLSLDFATLFPIGVLAADTTGLAGGAWLLPPGTAGRALWLQGVTPGALPLQLSPVVGGVVR